jgi:hypothetical protein
MMDCEYDEDPFTGRWENGARGRSYVVGDCVFAL